MSDRALQEIQALQFHDLPAANAKMLEFLQQSDLPFHVESVEVRPLAVSLNSINGFITAKFGQKLFFKTHIEPQSIISEYYNAEILADAAYPVIQPLYGSTEYGKQLLIYDYFDAPSLFNVLRDIETGDRQDGEQVVAVQEQADRALLDIYLKTLTPLSSVEHSASPIHQLFFHRLTGGRYATFYADQSVVLPQQTIPFAELSQWQWRINGIEYQQSLQDIIQQAIQILDPSQRDIWSIVGHGDAHNGNVFLEQDQLIYFDPAFAGRHSPLLDLTKPLFHNVFATWMYFPQAVNEQLQISWQLIDQTIIVDHNFYPIPERIKTLKSKLHFVLKPLLQHLKNQGNLDSDWQEYLKAALFCCPFLTMNLLDTNKFPAEITLLGLSLAVEMGSNSNNQSLLDRELAAIAQSLH